MRTAIVAVIVLTAPAAPVAAQTIQPSVVQSPAWRKAVTPTRALAAEDARVRGRAAFLSGKSPDVLIAEVRAAHPRGGDEMVAAALKEARATGKAEVETLKGGGLMEPGQAQQQQLKAAMDRLTTFEQALSNLLRKMSETQAAVTSNLK